MSLHEELKNITTEELLSAYESIVQPRPLNTVDWTKSDWIDSCHMLREEYPNLAEFIDGVAESDLTGMNGMSGIVIACLALGKVAQARTIN